MAELGEFGAAEDIRDPIKLLVNEALYSLMSHLWRIERGSDIDALSDYEKLAFLCSSWHWFEGCDCALEMLDTVTRCFGETADRRGVCRDPSSLWKRACLLIEGERAEREYGRMATAENSAEKRHIHFFENRDDSYRNYVEKDKKICDGLSFEDYFEMAVCSSESLEEFCGRIVCDIREMSKNKEILFIFPLSAKKEEVGNPNPYLGEKIFEKLKNGERIDSVEKYILSAQTIYWICKRSKCEKLQLMLSCEEDLGIAERLVGFIRDRGFLPRFFLGFDVGAEPESVKDICLSLSVRPALILRDESPSTDEEKLLERLSRIYPASLIRLIRLIRKKQIPRR